MGLVCSCFGLDNGDHDPSPFCENFTNKWKSLFHRGQVEVAALSDEVVTVETATITDDDTHSDSEQNNCGEVVKPLDKAFVQSSDDTPVLVQQALKTLAIECEENEVVFPCSDDEDVCPTCLEEYDDENPKIMTQCNHHYHLACIYEWMERSPSCPVCSKLMLFEQEI